MSMKDEPHIRQALEFIRKLPEGSYPQLFQLNGLTPPYLMIGEHWAIQQSQPGEWELHFRTGLGEPWTLMDDFDDFGDAFKAGLVRWYEDLLEETWRAATKGEGT